MYSQKINANLFLNTKSSCMKKIIILSFFVVYVQSAFAQFFGQIPQSVKYNAAKVIDPVYGIKMYEKLNFAIGGDSVRNDKKGYACQGWISDTYESGGVIHKGYYEDGHLTAYKNFYENGTVERSFKMVDFKRSNMQLFFPDGKLKSNVTYYEGNPQIWIDYYNNGQIEYSEESAKSMEYLISRKSYAEDGKPQEIFEMTDPKKKLYFKKEYYENGNIKEEGQLRFNPAAIDYQKIGTWKVYDESGKVSEENWVNGERVASK
jgi:antitoxin component YwqK of YwqJK toxin-antitoxin module